MGWIAKYWIEVLFGVVATGLSAACRYLWKKVKAREQEVIDMRAGLVAILHDRLYQECSRLLEQGWTTVEDLKNLEYIYKAYHALGGNGTGTELYNRALKLPINSGRR